MKKIVVITILLLNSLVGYSQTNAGGSVSVDLSKLDQIPVEKTKKVEAAFEVMHAVQKAGKYIQSLSELFTQGILELPVGIKKGGYELIVQRITQDEETGKTIIHATCAFKLKDSGQAIAFEGEAELTGRNGLGTRGALTLIAPARRNIGSSSSLVIHEGTKVNFGCGGIESFDALMSWIVTSPQIIPVDGSGKPTNAPLATTFEVRFQDFDSYLVSLNINQSFSIKGLDDIIFTLKGAILDQSDTESSAMLKFPDKYFSRITPEDVKLWKGLAVAEASISLPGAFKKPGSNGKGERITVALQQVLFDENGFTGNVVVKDLISSETLDREQWGISVNDFLLGIMKNEVVAFGFGGDVNIPPFGEHSLLPYMAAYNYATENYEFRVNIQGKYKLPVLKSSVTLNELSTIDLVFKNSDVYPSIHASGVLDIDAPLGSDGTQKFSIPGISFENMVISRESPYLEIGVLGVTGNLQTPKLAGFELSISDIHTINNQKGSGLAFTAGVTLNDMFGGTAGLQLYGDYQHWKFREVAVDRIHVEYRSKPFTLLGGVWFKNGDPMYGNGFRGDLRLSLLEKFDLDAVAVFGKIGGNRYFLTDVFFEMPPPAGIIVPPALSFNGFGGGLYRHMQQTGKMPQPARDLDAEFGKSLSGISYVPDEKVGFGFMASTKFGLASSAKAFNAKVGLEMQFNTSGGLNFAQFRGEATFMDSPAKFGSLSENVSGNMQKLDASDVKQPEKAKKSDINKVPESKGGGFLTASLNVEYDLINSTFSADLNAYLNAGLIKGIGENDRIGWASAYFSPGKWYTYMGTPSDRMGISVLNLAQINGYFMLGSDIPPLPPPPPRVLSLLSAEKQARISKRTQSESLSIGKGIAFGAGLEFGFDARLVPFYARFHFGMGAEFALTDLGNRLCANYSGTPGINGWYAQAQVWAYIDAGVGIEVKVFKKRRSFNILDLSVGALLEGAGPNPMYFAGSVGGRFSVLGGLVKGNCTFDFEVGDKCKLTGGSPFGEDVIAQLTPMSGEKDVNVFAAPQVLFNVPVEREMMIDEDDGARGIYKVTLEDFYLKYKDTETNVTGRSKLNGDGKICMISLDDPFESQKDVIAYARIGFKKKINGQWVYVTGDDGKPVFEDKSVAFHTGNRPKEILPEHVKYTYPIDRQYNFYPKEYGQGYILVTQNYSYLFSTEKPEGFYQAIKVSDLEGQSFEMPFTYRTNGTGSGIRLEIDFSMNQASFNNNKIYTLAIVNIPEAEKATMESNVTTVTTAVEGSDDISITKQQATETLTQLSEKEIYALHFRSSRYNTFVEKINTFDKQSEGWRSYVEPFVHDIKTNLRETELFDKYETQGIAGGQAMLRFDAQLNRTDWYTGSFYRGMYLSDNTRGVDQNRDLFNATQSYGTPPSGAVAIVMEEDNKGKTLTNDEINVGVISGYKNTGNIIKYSVPYWCARDFFHIKRNIAEQVYRGGKISQEDIALMNTDFPPVVAKGDYPVQVSYTLPGRNIKTSTAEMTMYNPVTP